MSDNNSPAEHVSRTELALLEYLRAHSCASGERIPLDPKAIKRVLRIDATQFADDAAGLAGRGLAGIRGFRSNENGDRLPGCSAIWLTIKGEDYLDAVARARRAAAAPRTLSRG
jgi:hypothetical protein